MFSTHTHTHHQHAWRKFPVSSVFLARSLALFLSEGKSITLVSLDLSFVLIESLGKRVLGTSSHNIYRILLYLSRSQFDLSVSTFTKRVHRYARVSPTHKTLPHHKLLFFAPHERLRLTFIPLPFKLANHLAMRPRIGWTHIGIHSVPPAKLFIKSFK